MKTTTLLLLCCLLCLALFTEAHKNKGGKPKHGRGHSRSDSRSDSHSDSHSHEHDYHDNKCPSLQALTWNELGYLKTYDNAKWAENPIALGDATFKHYPNGEIEVTCKCRSANAPAFNTVCQLKFDNGYDSFYSQNATTLSVNGDKDGHFDLVKTKGVLKINCDERTRQIRVDGTPLTHYTCFSGVFKNDVIAPPVSSGTKSSCPPLQSLSWTDLVKYTNTWANQPYRLQPFAMGEVSFNNTAKGLEMTCRCKPAKGKNNYCALEFDNGFDSYWTQNSTAINVNNKKNGKFAVIKSKNFVSINCDASTGNFLVNGTALTNYVCYSAHFINDCELPPTGNIAKCRNHYPHHSNSYSHSHSHSHGRDSSSNSYSKESGSDSYSKESSSESKGSRSNSDESR